MPEFEDVQHEHENDNSFIQSVMADSVSQLNKITYNYCRYIYGYGLMLIDM